MSEKSQALHNRLSDDAIMVELGSRLSRYRIDAGMTQQLLADKAGISKSTLERIEAGSPSQLPNLIRLLRALDLLSALELALPAPAPRPMELLRHQRKPRQRVRKKQGSAQTAAPAPPNPESATPTPWKWGDERE